MKRSAIRLCSAVLLMGLVITASVMLIGATTKEQAPAAQPQMTDTKTYVWVRVLFATEPRAQEIFLYDSEGHPMQRLTPDESGMAASELLNPGQYYAATEGCCTEFTLNNNASIRVDGGSGWSDGEILYLSGAEIGTVTLERTGPASDDDGWLDYTLKNEEFERREVLRCSSEKELLTCTFAGVPYGTYVLWEDGVERCTVTVDERTPDVTVTLP